MNEIRVLIVDDVEWVRQDLCTFLTLAGDIEIVGEAANGLEAIEMARALQPPVILMDLEMPILDGYEATRQIKRQQPACRVIILSIHGDSSVQESAIRAGADDFIVKGASLDILLQAIRKASSLSPKSKGEQT
jgi:DNA-binding NarL/FixJ family response regulator